MYKTTKAEQIPSFKLERPDLNQINRQNIIEELEKSSAKYRKIFENANIPDYIYWDRFKYKFPDADLSSEGQWLLIRQLRNVSAVDIEIKAENGEHFRWLRLPSTDEFLHKIDMLAGGQLFPHSDILSPTNRQTFINRGIIEEAIASSQLEGAHTTRAAARRMIIEKQEPKSESERMILNNYTPINAIEEEYKHQPLTVGLLFEIHSRLTSETINKAEQNRFRDDNDEIVVQGQIGAQEYITHTPPGERFLKEEVDRLITYANDKDGGKFIHPIIKAIFIHFWIGYLHPFTDGNGRLARALFYWYLLRKGYWTFMYLPISTVIKKAPVQYAMAYIYSEQDNNDITYFYDFHIKKIVSALEDFKAYINKKINENQQVDKLLEQNLPLNERQKQLIHYLLSDNKLSTTVSSHATINAITRQTAARDLKELEAAGLTIAQREGKYIRYYSTPKLKDLMQSNNQN